MLHYLQLHNDFLDKMIEPLITLGYVLVTGIIGLVTGAVIYARWNYGTLEKIKGVPKVITPAFVGGSDIHVYKKVVHEEDTENVKKYGKIYGVSSKCVIVILRIFRCNVCIAVITSKIILLLFKVLRR